jgi:hypothetical protein
MCEKLIALLVAFAYRLDKVHANKNAKHKAYLELPALQAIAVLNKIAAHVSSIARLQYARYLSKLSSLIKLQQH